MKINFFLKKYINRRIKANNEKIKSELTSPFDGDKKKFENEKLELNWEM